MTERNKIEIPPVKVIVVDDDAKKTVTVPDTITVTEVEGGKVTTIVKGSHEEQPKKNKE